MAPSRDDAAGQGLGAVQTAGSPVALVTGGSRGIGAATCRLLAARGYRVGVGYLKGREAAQGVVEAIRAGGGDAVAVQGDVGRWEQASSVVAEVARRWGRLDVLVNNAGHFDRAPVSAIDPERWQRMLEVHLSGAFYCARAALPWLQQSPQACIVNVASTAALTGGTSGVHYAAAKGGVLALTLALARELAPLGIRVNAVVPGKIRTAMLGPDDARVVPLGRAGDPEEVAEAIAFLASPQASFITGTWLVVSGGYGVLQGPAG